MGYKPDYEELEKKIEKLEKEIRILKQSNKHQDFISNNIPDVIFKLDPNGIITYINKAVEIYGYLPEDLIGKNIFKIVYPDDIEYAIYRINERRTGERTTKDLQIRLFTNKGEERTFDSRVGRNEEPTFYLAAEGMYSSDELSPGVFLGTQGIARDITERTVADEALRLSEEMFKAQFKAIPVPTYIWQKVGNDIVLKDYNDAADIFTNGQVAKLIGITAKKMYSDNPKILEEISQCLEHKINIEREMEYELISLDMTKQLAVKYAFVPPDLVMVHTEDITDRKEAEVYKIHLQQKLIHTQKMEDIVTLAGGIAHDFNNLLGVIIGNLDIIQMYNEPVPTDVKHHIEKGITAAKRGTNLVKQLLTFSQQRKEEKKEFYIQPIIKEALKFLRAFIPSTITIEYDIDKYKPMISGDPASINQIVMNLYTNAYHAMEKNGGTLEVILDKLTISKEDLISFPELKTGDYVHLSVSDTGYGIKKKDMDKIFDPIFTTKKDGKGAGLGLSTVYGIIKDYSGTIKVYSEVGKGTKFDIYIPEYEEEIRAREDTAKESIIRGNGTILLIDDDKAMLNTIEMSLVLLGYNVMSFEDSQEVLEVFKSEPDKFDLVMTDLTMPNLTGDQLADKIHEIKPDIPIILSSGLVIEEEKSHIIYLSKPYDLVTVSKIISKNIGFRKRH